LLIVAGFFSCDKQSSIAPEEVEFCSYLNFEDINETIPIVNEFLAGLPDGISKEQTFQSLVTWFKSCPCIIDAAILYSDAAIYPPEVAGVSISVKDNETIRELYLDFAVIDCGGYLAVTYSQIAGYFYAKQDRIHVKTKYTKIDKVFDFINSLEFDVEQIQSGWYLSTMTPSTDNLQYIVNGLKAKPYTNDSWVTGNMNGYNNQINIHITLYDMKDVDYQADWFKSMNEYQLEEHPFQEEDDNIYGPGHIIVFQIPEGTGKQWETKFMEYEFVRWAEKSHSRCNIR